MRIAINAVSATSGGARSYLLNLARVLPELEPHEYLLYIPASAAAGLPRLPENFRIVPSAAARSGYAARLVWEQVLLPRQVRRWGADVLVCVGNFCPLRSKAPVLLLSRNALYFTPRYAQDLRERGHHGWILRHHWMTRLAVESARAARLTITPTAAMEQMVRSAAGAGRSRLRTIPFGFQPWPGQNGCAAPPPAAGPFRFLIVSHYNYFRNFETVFRALAVLEREGRRVELILSTRLEPGLRLGGYDTTRAWRLIRELGLENSVSTVGDTPYDELPRLYGSAHAVICPSYAESFGHTVVESMAMGRPVIASDIPAHREVAGDAAVFFPAPDAQALAARCRELMDDEPPRRELLRSAGLARAAQFSWRRHFELLLAAAAEAARGPRKP